MVAAVTVMVAGTLAATHGRGADSSRAGDFVRQAIALIVSKPGGVEMIRDKVGDALVVDDSGGVDLAVVAQAAAVLDGGGDMHAVRALLELSIGARSHLNGGEVAPIRESSATGDASGSEFVADPLGGRIGFDGVDWALLVVSVLVGLTGVWLGLRYRPGKAIVM